MIPSINLRTAIAWSSCGLVLFFLFAPRLVVHRHTDFENQVGSQFAVAAHLERCHEGGSGCSVGPCDLHFHWSFSLPPDEVPSSSATDRGMLFHSQSNLDSTECFASSIAVPSICSLCSSSKPHTPRMIAGWLAPSPDFKRIQFGVWIL